MKHTLALLLLLPSLALAQQRVAVSLTETQILTRAAPTLSTEGAGLTEARGLRVSVCAATGQTLSGAGTLKAWYLNPSGLWNRNSALDLSIPATASGIRCWAFPDMAVLVRTGRALFATDSVTVSGGTTVIVRIDVGL